MTVRIAPESIDEAFVPTTDPAVVSVELDGEAVLYHESLNTVNVLSVIATIIWRCLDGSSDLQDVCDDLAAVFEVDVERVRHDVLTVVREFGRQGLLDGVEPDPDVVAEHVLAPARDESFDG